MDLIDAVRVMLRQWRVLAIGIVVVVLAAVAAIFVVPTRYQATGQLVMLLPPQSTGNATPTNPFLNLEPGLTITASLIAATLTTKDSARTLEAAGFSSEYTIALNPGNGPVLEISVEDTDGAMAVRTRDEVISRLDQELTRIQLAENAPQRQVIHARPNSVANVAEPLPGSKIRALAVIGALGAVLTLFIAFVRDRLTRNGGAIFRPEAAPGAPPELQPEPATKPATDPGDDPAPAEAPVADPTPETEPSRIPLTEPTSPEAIPEPGPEPEPVTKPPVWPPLRPVASDQRNGKTRRKLKQANSGAEPTWWDT